MRFLCLFKGKDSFRTFCVGITFANLLSSCFRGDLVSLKCPKNAKTRKFLPAKVSPRKVSLKFAQSEFRAGLSCANLIPRKFQTVRKGLIKKTRGNREIIIFAPKITYFYHIKVGTMSLYYKFIAVFLIFIPYRNSLWFKIIP